MNEKSKASSGERWTEALRWYNAEREADEKQRTRVAGLAWHEWYADQENRRVFDQVKRLLASRIPYPHLRRPRRGELEKDRYDLSVPIADWLGADARRESKKRRVAAAWVWWLSGGAAAAALLALLCLSPLRSGSNGPSSAPAVYQTGVGELREIHLRDGSSVTLGGQTKVLVTFSAQRRSVDLKEGQAWFKVAHNRNWPFMVTAGNGTITAVGTAFCVTRDSDRVVIAVTEGTVEVSERPRPRLSPRPGQKVAARPVLMPIRVARGEEFAFGDEGALARVKPTDTHAAVAWTSGRLTFDDQPLRYVIETVDRYSSRHILASPAAGALRFTGIVFDNEIEDWLRSLQGIFPVTVDERGADIRIQMRSSNPTREHSR